MRYLRRFIWYIATRLLIVLLCLGILTVTFYFAMNASNIYVIIKDGMARRAQVVMRIEKSDELNRYFSSVWISRDALVQAAENGSGPYENCNITGIDHRISLSYVWCWPWDSTATAQITETIPSIDGRSVTGAVPKWNNARYSVALTKENGQWKIKDLTVLEWLNDE